MHNKVAEDKKMTLLYPRKKAYSKPVLETLGRLGNFTQSGPSNGGENAMSGMVGPTYMA